VSKSSRSLAELQAMSREDLKLLFPQKHPKWKKLGYEIETKTLTKAIIRAAKEVEWPITGGKGVTEFWYNPVKPILLKAIGERANEVKVQVALRRTTIKYLSQMVKEGILQYTDLGITDFRTRKEIFKEVEKVLCWKNIMLFVEKDAAYGHLKPLQELFNINILSGGGWSHTAGIERILNLLKKHGITEFVVFTLTDYDSFGFAIDQEFVDKCETLGLKVKEHHRIGINVKHATPEILDVQKYPVKHGKKLTVNDICFDSDLWLAEYGIDGKYGLEIEAISAQPNGPQFLREIVAKELLKYLRETDRVEEITKKVWENAPYKSLSNLMYNIERYWPERESLEKIIEHIKNGPQRPHQYMTEDDYLTYQEYIEQYSDVQTRMEEETEDLQEEIDDLQEQISELEGEKDTLEQPFRKEMDALGTYYALSRRILIYCLWRYYQKHKEKWPRDHYSLGFPKGCLVTATQEQKDLAEFLKQVSDKEIITDIMSALKDAMNNGEIQQSISKILNGGGVT